MNNFTPFFFRAKSFERLCYSLLAVLVTLCACMRPCSLVVSTMRTVADLKNRLPMNRCKMSSSCGTGVRHGIAFRSSACSVAAYFAMTLRGGLLTTICLNMLRYTGEPRKLATRRSSVSGAEYFGSIALTYEEWVSLNFLGRQPNRNHRN